MTKHFKVERDGPVATLTLARPTVRNAFSIALMRELTAFARACEDDKEIDVVLVTGGTDYFSAGADLRDPDRFAVDDKPFVEQRDAQGTGFRMCKAWEAMPQITIAAIEGYAIGGGVAFSLACDWRVMANNAFLSMPEIGLGFPLTWGTIPRIVGLAGPAQAKRIVILCERMNATEAREFGLVDYIAPAGGALAKAQTIAAQVTALPRHSVRMTKETINTLAGVHNALGAHATGDQFLLASRTEESKAARSKFKLRK